MQDIKIQDLWAVIIGLVVVIISSWSMFGWIVKRWISNTDDRINELFDSRNNANIEIAQRKIICDERHKNK